MRLTKAGLPDKRTGSRNRALILDPRSKYTPALFAEICALLSSGMSLRKALLTDSRFPHIDNFLNWVNSDHSLHDQYTRAMSARYDALAEEAIEISANTAEDANSRRVRVDTIKWFVSKLAARKYGDKLAVDHSGTISLRALLEGKDAPTNE